VSARIIGLFAVFVITLAALRGTSRAVPTRCSTCVFFRSAPFSGATVIAICAFAALAGFLFLNTLYLQDVRGLSALTAGLCISADGRHDPDIRPLSGRIVADRGPRLPLLIGRVALWSQARCCSADWPTTPLSRC